MTYVVTEACIGVKEKSCIDVCPVDCILEVERMLVIDPDECIDCGACEPICPVTAIYAEETLPPEFAPFLTVNAAITDSPQAVDEMLDKLSKNDATA